MIEQMTNEDWFEMTPEDIGKWEYSKLEKFIKSLDDFNITKIKQLLYNEEDGTTNQYEMVKITYRDKNFCIVEQNDDKWLCVRFSYLDFLADDLLFRCDHIEEVINLIKDHMRKQMKHLESFKGFLGRSKDS